MISGEATAMRWTSKASEEDIEEHITRYLSPLLTEIVLPSHWRSFIRDNVPVVIAYLPPPTSELYSETTKEELLDALRRVAMINRLEVAFGWTSAPAVLDYKTNSTTNP
jgi:hypothetical protein